MANQQVVMNPRTGKTEHVFAKLEAVYPTIHDLSDEYSFEELRARHRGWLDKQWTREAPSQDNVKMSETLEEQFSQLSTDTSQKTLERIDTSPSQQDSTIEVSGADQTLSDITTTKDVFKQGKCSRPRRKKLMEVKGETQTGK